MSLSLVFAPAQVVEEMAEALPVCLGGGGRTTVRHLPAAKRAQQTVLKDFFFSKKQTAAMPDKSTNEGQ